MDSFGIWYSPRNDISSTSISGDHPLVGLHINLWDMSTMGTQPFIDIGLLIPDYHVYDTVFLYMPFLVNDTDITDLSPVLAKKEIADLVFNDSCATTNESMGVKTLERDEGDKVILYEFGKNGDGAPKIEKGNTQKSGHGWSFVEFDIGRFSRDSDIYGQWKKLYLRFRITSPYIESELFCDLALKNRFLESAFESTRVVDIKFNMKRNIAGEAIKRMREENNRVVEMENVHFLLIEPANNNVDSYGREPKDCRKLENEWTEYLWRSESRDVGDLLAFHWKESKKDDDGFGITEYAQMVRVTSAATNWRVIAVYILVGILLNVIASVFFEGIKSAWPVSFDASAAAIGHFT